MQVGKLCPERARGPALLHAKRSRKSKHITSQAALRLRQNLVMANQATAFAAKANARKRTIDRVSQQASNRVEVGELVDRALPPKKTKKAAAAQASARARKQKVISSQLQIDSAAALPAARTRK